MSVTYQLRPQYVGQFGGGVINVGGNGGYSFDVGAALTAGAGSIIAVDSNLVNALDDYAPLFRSSQTADPLIPALDLRVRTISVANGANVTETVFEARRANELYPRWRLLANGAMEIGDGTQTPLALNLSAANALAGQNSQSGTTYTLALADAGKMVLLNNVAAITLTVPPQSAVPFALNALVLLQQAGAGQVTVAPGAGVTLRSRGTALKTAGQYAVATLWQQATDVWVLWGDVIT